MFREMKKFALAFIALGVMHGCDTEIDPDQNENSGPFQEIQWGQDVTGQLQPWELIQYPEHTPASQVGYLDDEEVMLVIKLNGEIFTYPLKNMLVEVVNEERGGALAAITYCPITKSSVAFDRLLGGDTLLLTASGYLLRDNLMPLDLNSGSIWSQMKLVGMYGPHDKVNAKVLPMFETSWETVRTHFSDAWVFLHDPLQKSAWASNEEASDDSYTDRKLGILSRDQVEVFDPQLFSGEMVLHTTLIQPGGNVVVAGSSEKQFVVAYRTNYSMEPAGGEFPIIMRDETGTGWNIFGEAVGGERKGEQLDSPVSYTASHWAWEALFARVSEFSPS